MTDSAVASILWARSPALAPDLPRRQILATAYAGMQPDAHLWHRYLSEVTNLERRGTINADDAILLRSTIGRESLMEATLGVEDDVSPETPADVLQRVRTEIARPIEEQLREEREERERLERQAESDLLAWVEQGHAVDMDVKALIDENEALKLELESEREKAQARQTLLEGRAQASARRTIRLTAGATVAVLAIGGALRVFNPEWLPAWLSYLCVAAAAIILVLGVLRHVFGGTVLDWIAPVEKRLADRNFRRLLQKAAV
jgi:hypothetical protein